MVWEGIKPLTNMSFTLGYVLHDVNPFKLQAASPEMDVEPTTLPKTKHGSYGHLLMSI